MKNRKILTEFARVINSDRYQYTESDVLLMEGMQDREAVFDMFFRKTEDGGFAVVSGIQEVISLIDILNNTSKEEKRRYFSEIIEERELLEFLVELKFTGDIYAMRDGEIVYPNEPVVTVKAPMIQAKILETPILNIMNMNLAIATKASMVTRAASPVPVSSFGSRRAHGFDSAVSGNKAAYIGGCSSHSNLVTEYTYGIPSVGTMAHSFVQAFGLGGKAEKKAFDAFIKHRKTRKNKTIILLIDTYNTLETGIKNAVEAFRDGGIDDSYEGIYGIRIDSGDLAYLSKKCRKELREAGFNKAKIFLTSSIDEEVIKSLKEQQAEVDYYGVGDAIGVSKSNPCFGGVYKIVEVDGKPVMKLSEDVVKISTPGFKEVYRIYDTDGVAYADIITLARSDGDREKLINNEDILIRDEHYAFKESKLKRGEYSVRLLTRKYVQNGEIMDSYRELLDANLSREYYLRNLERISEERRRLKNPHSYKVNLSIPLLNLKYELIKKIKETF